MRPILCIAGPTASGKSDWAVELAKKHDGEVLNADSMQIYRDLHILSARPMTDDMRGIPHHLFGYIDGVVRYSVGQWIRDVEPVISDCLAREKMPIVTGGTGLYLTALVDGLAQIPSPGPAAKAQADMILEMQGISALRSMAVDLDPTATRKVLGDDPQRLLRIVSVALGTDKPLSDWQTHTKPVFSKNAWLGAILMPDRDVLYSRINRRFDTMIECGALDEITWLQARNLSADLPVMKAVGVPPLLAYRNGNIGLAEAITMAKRDSRRFAKRQFTWFKGHGRGWHMVSDESSQKMFENYVSQNTPLTVTS
ncbi:MAG: tRNA (adenosine(37)-N6)-dimethylallyltransferase MiaA [Hyphomonadaceae bacterium]|nr:tRNA (adenosine(37)-N6)-dimethylallyltransferase MiaA [Hyphomonadaceae bacterium]